MSVSEGPWADLAAVGALVCALAMGVFLAGAVKALDAARTAQPDSADLLAHAGRALRLAGISAGVAAVAIVGQWSPQSSPLSVLLAVGYLAFAGITLIWAGRF